MDTLAVFRSRNAAIYVYNYLKKRRIACITVSTPSRLGFGCGISIIVNHAYTHEIQSVIQGYGITSFAGFFPR